MLHVPLDIDWSRVARPQEDQYDTDVALALAAKPLIHCEGVAADSFFDGDVRIGYATDGCPYDAPLVNGPLTHNSMSAASNVVRCWPEAYAQCKRLLTTFHPLWDNNVSPDAGAAQLSSSSGAREDLPGIIFATVEHHLTLAEAIVHEMAHNKLFFIGIGIDSARRLITNSCTQRAESPVIRDRLRPVTAVFHAVYTFTYIGQLDIHMVNNADGDDRRDALLLLAGNIPVLERGKELLDASLSTDDEGLAFYKGFRMWLDEVISSGNTILADNGQAKVPLRQLTAAS